MKRILFLLFISSPAFAQQPTVNKHDFNDFVHIEKVEDKEKYFNEMLKEQLPEKATNDFRAELAYAWLAKGNVERYSYYKATNPKIPVIQFYYLSHALEKLFDEKKQYQDVEKISRELLNDLEKGTLSDGVSRTPVLMELNAASNAKLGNVDAAVKMMAKSSAAEGSASREIHYFKDMKSNFINRQAIVLLAAGQYQSAFDLLSKSFRDAESNPYMVATFMEVYKKVKGTDEGFEQYLTSLRTEAYNKYFKEVEKMYVSTPTQMLNGSIPDPNGGSKKLTTFYAKKPVKDISLLNLDGKSVNLGDYKGKILAIDFWSTGCTPCVAAFAGFERTVADYTKNEFQLFVVNLFEPYTTVKSYVAQKGIVLDVLRDEENTAYNVQATPTKIIFDPKGNIRFYSTGYAGSTDREYYKLKAMIEIVKARAAGNGSAKAKK